MNSKFIIKLGGSKSWLSIDPEGSQSWTADKSQATSFDRRNDSALYIKSVIEKKFNCLVEVQDLL